MVCEKALIMRDYLTNFLSAGPMYSFTILGQTFIVISDKQIAFDLLEKRSSIYSSRPPYTFGGEM